MAKCTKCGEMTLFKHGSKMVCSKCGNMIHIPVNEGKGGKGQKCPACKRFTWFNGRCTSCGAHE